MSFVRMVEAWRGEVVESVHFGAAVLASANGDIIGGWGDTNLLTYARSALKPIQAIALIETGAAEAHGLTPKHLALACGSHRAEPIHTALVTEWLRRLALDQRALACGADAPADSDAAAGAIREGHPRQRIYHNCSGKHCGFLTVITHRGWPVEGYDRLEHPAQQLYLDALSELARCDARALPFGIDGCTLPAAALPLSAIAVTMARFAKADVSSPGRRAAIRAIQDAMRLHPEYVSGTDQPGVQIARATQGRIVVKTGAEGFMVAYLPQEGVAAALKIADGAARAREPALIALLASNGLLEPSEVRELAHLLEPPVLDSAGRPVGRLRACGPGRDEAHAPAAARAG